MTIKDCIDIVDNIKPNQYTIKDKVMWLSFIDEIIINEVLKTHEGYDGRYDDFKGYAEDRLSVPLIVPSPYDRLYTAYLKMKIDGENGETARYNNSVALYNTYMSEYRKHYNKTHLPLNITGRKTFKPVRKATLGLSDAEYENLKKDLTFILTEYFSDMTSDDKISAIINDYVQNNIEMLKGKDGLTPKKGVDYFTEEEVNDIKVNAKGENGVSPDVSINKTDDGHVITISDSEGTHRFKVLNGLAGDSAYEVAVKNGFKGTEEEWLNNYLAKNLKNGETKGSLCSISASEETEDYKLGENALALGLETKAIGAQSVALGENTEARLKNDFAHGSDTVASGKHSHAEGHTTVASGYISHSEGYHTTASGNFSHAEGHTTVTSGNMSHAEGYETTAVGRGTHTEGLKSVAEGEYSHAEGVNKTTTIGYGSHAEGDATRAEGTTSHAEGYHTCTKGANSHAEGRSTTSMGSYSHAEGRGTTTLGNSSHSSGESDRTAISVIPDLTQQTDNRAIIEVWDKKKFSLAKGTGSSSSGLNTLALGDHSETSGTETCALGNNSHAEGLGTKASGENQHVSGRYNIEDTENKYACIVGNGSKDSPSNAYTLDWEGSATFAGKVTGKDGELASVNYVGSEIKGKATQVNTYVNNNFANAFKGNASGAVVSIDDTSPIEHDVGVKVSSKNLLRLDKATVIGSTFGKKLTEDGTGVIIPANTTVYGICFAVDDGSLLSHLKAGNTYTLSCESDDYDFSRVDSGWRLSGVNGSVITQNKGKVRTITPTEDIKTLRIYLGSPVTLENEVIVSNFMAEESEQKTEYTPYVDVSTVNVKTLGKNLIDITKTKKNGTINFTTDNDVITITGPAGGVYGVLWDVDLEPNETYTISCDCSQYSSEDKYGFRLIVDGVIESNSSNSNSFTFTRAGRVTRIIYYLGFPYNYDGTTPITISNVQLEKGETATSYEPYKPASYPVETDGRAEGVKSIYPNMTITTDTAGVVVDCEYNRDSNKALEKLTNAIISLGGNI